MSQHRRNVVFAPIQSRPGNTSFEVNRPIGTPADRPTIVATPSQKQIDVVDINLNTAGSIQLNVSGSVIYYNDSTSVNDTVTIRLNDDTSTFRLRPGAFIRGLGFSKLSVSWGAQAGSSAQLMLIQDFVNDQVGVE